MPLHLLDDWQERVDNFRSHLSYGLIENSVPLVTQLRVTSEGLHHLLPCDLAVRLLR